MSFKVPEKHRCLFPKGHSHFSDESFGNNGVFRLVISKKNKLNIMASDGGGWDHVSVSAKGKTPSYYEMKKVRRLFWGDDDVVVEYHMGEKDHINIHSNVLHLWCWQGGKFPTPPKLFV